MAGSLVKCRAATRRLKQTIAKATDMRGNYATK
jgi:hypothetical protein